MPVGRWLSTGMLVQWCIGGRRSRRRRPGQALALVAVVLPFLLILVLTAVELGVRLLQRAEAEDALHDAARSAVQAMQYAQLFGAGTLAVRPADVLAVGQATLQTNLSGVRGLAEPPDAVAAAARWIVVTTPATQPCADSTGQPVLLTAPGVCATLDVPLSGWTGRSVWSPRVFVAVTLDAASASAAPVPGGPVIETRILDELNP